MHWLSKSAELLIDVCAPNKAPKTQDVVVIGSGYGGAVAALRFAQHGLTVAVLERGKEYVAGEFPNDVSQAGQHVRAELATTAGVTTQGYEDSLFDFRIGLRSGALIGNGLGGGSLINAGVGLQPDARVFKQEEWPATLRQENLDAWYQRARDMHELQTPGKPGIEKTQPLDMTQTSKFQRMKDLHAQAPSGKTQIAADNDISCAFEAAPIAVQLDSPVPEKKGPRSTCNGCGDCVTGCNYNAKLTLTATYLPEAVQAGADIFTGLTVLHISHEPEENQAFPWVVHFIRTSERRLQHDIANNHDLTCKKPPAASEDQWIYKLRARRVVVSAGTFGSTEILLRSRVKGLSLSRTALGMGVSGNGDDVAYGYDLRADANATGWGSKPAAPHHANATKVVGPTITSIIRFTDKADVTRSTLTQDGAVPGLVSGAVDELLTTLATVAQIGKFSFRKSSGTDPLAIQPEALKRTLTLLGMGHDSAGGTIVYDAKTDRAAWGWPNAAQEKTPKLHRSRMRGLVEKTGGIYLQNPAAGLLPDGLSGAQSGPKAEGLVFTVHPLGGCRMGDVVLTSVVNHWGCAWTAEGDLHDGLYVMDGSVIPSSLGANPMLTITALAERSCSLILQSVGQVAPTPRQLPAYPIAPKPLVMDSAPHSSTRLAEALRGKLQFSKPLMPGIPAGLNSVALFLQFDIKDWRGLLTNENHEVDIYLPPADEHSYKKSRLIIDFVPHPPLIWPQALELTGTGGTINLFYQEKSNWLAAASRYCRTLATYAIDKWYPERKKKQTLQKMANNCDSNLTPQAKVTGQTLNRLITTLRAAFNAAKSRIIEFFGFFLLCKHANEARAFDYRIELQSKADPNKKYTLIGSKTIQAAASWRAISQQLRASGWPLLERRSIWQQLTELDIELFEVSDTSAMPMAKGLVVMDLPDMLRRVVPELQTKGDSLNALLELAGYPMLFLRAILKTRILDLKLPDYKVDGCGKNALPDVDPALVSKPPGYFELSASMYPTLEMADRRRIGPVVTPLEVPHSWPKRKSQSIEMIRLGLVRYKHPVLQRKREPDGAYKAKSIMLMNGFDLSTQPFVAQELNHHGGNLVTNLLNAGWDVWLFEYRASPLLDASARYSTMDDMAAFDIPKAVGHILKTVSAELKTPEDQTQIFAFTHCVGSASMAMSLLGGYLERNSSISQLAGVSFSQFHTQVVGSSTAQMRLQLAALLSNVLKMETLEFVANTVRANFLYATLDRLFATSHYWQAGSQPAYAHQVYNQCCPGDKDLRTLRPDSTTCKRMTGLLSRLFEHDQLLDETHEKLDDYFGRSNLGVYMQGAKCTEYERLVNADGQNVYVTHNNIQAYLNMPLMLIHGAKNVLFEKESATRSWNEMQRIRSTQPNSRLDKLLVLKDYAHFDCTIGKTAALDVFKPAVAFFESAFTSNVVLATNTPAQPQQGYIARLPRTGPIVGWVRPGPGRTTLIRVWIEVDTTDAETPIEVLSFVQHGGSGADSSVDSCAVVNQMMDSPFFVSPAEPMDQHHPLYPAAPAVSYAVADISVPNQYLASVKIEMVSIHASTQLGFVPSVLKQTAVTPQALLKAMKLKLDIANDKTRQADPATLSRLSRTSRSYTDRVVELARAQLATSHPSTLSFVAGGCKHPGLTGFERDRADGSLHAIVKQLDTTQPRFMLMLGDQIYADVRAGVMDTQSPAEKLLPSLRNAFGESMGFRRLARRLPMYMVIDDHEIHDDWSQEQTLGSYANEILARNAEEAFGIFQYAHSPGFPKDVTVAPGAKAIRVEGFNYCYEQNGIPFLVLDTRTQRKRVPTRQLLDASQWLWLEQWLIAEQAKGSHPKFVVSGSVVVPGLQKNAGLPAPRDADSWQLSPVERSRLLSFIADKNIDNVVFLSSDYHCSAAATITFTHSKVKAWAIVAPPLHAPMRFANVQPNEVDRHEAVCLARGRAIVQSQAWNGEGWLNCQIKRVSKTRHELELTFNVRQLAEESWTAPMGPIKWRL